jgi:hypothetical protein
MRAHNLYKNWVFPDSKTIDADFQEYKGKEDRKWKERARTIGARWPLFKDRAEFEASLRNAEIIDVTDAFDAKVRNRSHTSSLDSLKGLVSGYQMPRDVDRIAKGFQNGDPIPLPIILKGKTGMWIMAGNTRLDTAGILGVQKKALLVDVSG